MTEIKMDKAKSDCFCNVNVVIIAKQKGPVQQLQLVELNYNYS